MKKAFNYLMIVLLLLIVNVVSVNAENVNVTEAGNTDAEVTVGDVERPVYDVNISWENFTFDWRYDIENETYKWTHSDCQPITLDEYMKDSFYEDNIFATDASCRNVIYMPDEDSLEKLVEIQTEYQGTNLYYHPMAGEGKMSMIYITDSSTGGHVVPSVIWIPESKYDFTTASFKYIKDVPICISVYPYDDEEEYFINEDCTGERIRVGNLPSETNFYELSSESFEVDFEGSELPSSAANNAGLGVKSYQIFMELGVDTTKTITTPTAGDKIGTLTIAIETH